MVSSARGLSLVLWAPATRPAVSWLAFLLALPLAGCPPTGDIPVFEGSGGHGGAGGAGGGEPDTGVPTECIDHDGDNYVDGTRCALPGGDCDPHDASRNPAADEICNLVDDDCDTTVDEQNPGGNMPCEADALGACRAGTTKCEAGVLTCVAARAEYENCNGLDDDCDGDIDEDNPDGGAQCGTGEAGRCARGSQVCIGGNIECVRDHTPSTEVCNGLDDNCDGIEDEGNPGGGGACDTGQNGVCAIGEQRCQGGSHVCVVLRRPEAELCNGLDDDCDGQTDEIWGQTLGQRCEVGAGACVRDGIFVCAAGGNDVICDASAGNPTPELCNGFDDDCDGEIDERLGLGDACVVGVGACAREGTKICAGDGRNVVCNAEAGSPGPELCNLFDDDCDGEIDEAFPELGTVCATRLPAEDGVNDNLCPTTGIWACDIEVGAPFCDADPVAPVAELCNELDDDCDGEIDNGFEGKGASCELGVGACNRGGHLVCNADGDAVECDAPVVVPAVIELCDGVDNDCDGRIDNEAACPAAASGVVSYYQIVGDDDAVADDCRDFDGDRAPDNGIAGVAAVFNEAIAFSLATQTRLGVIRGRENEELADVYGLDFLVAQPVVGGVGVGVDLRTLDVAGAARARLEGVRIVGGAIDTVQRGQDIAVISPFFHDRDDQLWPWGLLALRDVTFDGDGDVGSAAAGSVHIRFGILTGAFERDEAVDHFRAAELACEAAGTDAPAGCSVFQRISGDEFDAALIADLDLDGDGRAESVSTCIQVRTVPAPDVAMPPVGRDVCGVDSDCVRGLVCRPVPVVVPGGLGAQLEHRCGLPGPGALPDGSPCVADDDCLHGTCAVYTAAGGRCTRLCDDDELPCPAGLTCRGVRRDVEGASNPGGASAKLCVPTIGTGESCSADQCAAGEVCGIWIEGEVGRAGGEVYAVGHCAAPALSGAPLGARCDSAFDCAQGNGCVRDPEGELRCARPCAATADCPAGLVCFDRPVGGVDGPTDDPLVHGYCLPLHDGQGSALPCTGELDCPGRETCRAHYLRAVGKVDRYCEAADGFFGVSQPCLADADCASDSCASGFCSSICDSNADCGVHLGCEPDLIVDDTFEIELGGACVASTRPCILDSDCDADPLCGGDRCICDVNVCRIGCRAPAGTCPAGHVCTENGSCVQYCRDDPDEPNEWQQDATHISIGRHRSHREDRHRLCVVSGVDWYRFDPRGQPVRVTVTPTGGDPGVALEAALYDAQGVVLDEGVPADDFGSWRAQFDDRDAAAARLGNDMWLRVRGAGIVSTADYVIETELVYPDCPDSAVEPRDYAWQWTPMLATPGGSAVERIDGWVCSEDTDWYSIYVGDGDRLTLDFETLGGPVPGRDRIEIDLMGPDFPQRGQRIIHTISADEGSGSIRFSPSEKFCDLETLGQPVCTYEDVGATVEACSVESHCTGGTYFVRVRGKSALDVGSYRIEASVERDAPIPCVPDPFEFDDFIDLPDRVFDGTAPGIESTVLNRFASIRANEDFVVDGFVVCEPDDLDTVTFAYDAGERLYAELRHVGRPQPLSLQIVEATQISVIDAVIGQEPVLSTTVEIDSFSYYSVVVGALAGITGGAPYSLTIRRETADHVRDTGCSEQTAVLIDPSDSEIVIVGTTLEANDDHRARECFGSFGPDRAYLIELPGPGTIRATVVTTGDDAYDPAVSIRLDCDVASSEIACNEDDLAANDPTARATTSVHTNQRQVWVIVDSFSAETAGAFTLTVRWEEG